MVIIQKEFYHYIVEAVVSFEVQLSWGYAKKYTHGESKNNKRYNWCLFCIADQLDK